MIEPLVFRTRIRWYEMVMGLLVICGLVLIFQFSGTEMNIGIMVGLFSAAVVAAASVWNKAVVSKTTNVYPIALVEFAAGWLFITMLLPFYQQSGYSDGRLTQIVLESNL